MPLPFTPSTLNDFISTPSPCALKACRNLKGNVLVLGAAGKMGLHLCLMLTKCFEQNGQSNQVIAVSRFLAPGSKTLFTESGIETLACDLSDPHQLAKLPDVENIWFMAGVKFGTSDYPGLLHKMNVEMPERVAERFQKSNIVALSTGCVYSFVSADSAGSTEDAPTHPEGAYALSCLGRETAFRKASQTTDLKCVLIRLNYAVELRYGVLVDIAQKIMDGESIDISMNRFNCIWQGDALAHIIAAISFAESPAAVLNITGPEILSIRETAESFGEYLGRPPLLTGSESSTCWLNNSEKAISSFGRPQVTPPQMIQWIAQWLQAGEETIGKPTKFEIRDGKY